VNLVIEINGLEPLLVKLGQWTPRIQQLMEKAANEGLYDVWQAVPPYPPVPPESTYRRTGTLSRTLGSSEGGGQTGGQPDVFEVKSGQGWVTGTFGTNLEYARYVIGDAGSEQAWMHRGWWWTLPQGVWSRARPKVVQRFRDAAEIIVKWMNGRL
jgi:hypothetical protein